MADLTPEQIRELDTLTAPRPAYDLNGLVGLDTGMNLNMPSAPAPAPYQPIPAGAGYQMQVDPMALSQGDTGDGGSIGLGLGSRGVDWGATLGGIGSILEAASAGYFGREPLFMKQQAREDQMQLRREAIQQQQAQLEEQGRQHDMQLLEKAMASPKANVMLEQLAQSPNFRFSKQAGMLSKGLKESDYGSMQAYLQFIPEDVQERFLNGKLPPHELSAWIDQAREEAKTNAKEQAKVAIFQRAQNKKPEERTPYEAQLVRDREDAERLKHAEIAVKENMAGLGGQKVNDLIGSERTRDILTSGGHNPMEIAQRAIKQDPEAMKILKSARAQSDQEQGALEEKKAFGRGMGSGDVPVGTEANKYTRLLPDGTSQSIEDSNIGKIEAGKQGYRDTFAFKHNIEQASKAKTALRSLKQLELYATELIKANGPLEIVEQAGRLSIQGITKAGAATKIPGKNGKMLTVGEVAKLYGDASQQLADQLAKGAGIVGTLTQMDTEKNLKGLADKYDTANIAAEKFSRFGKFFGQNILQEYESAYGRDGVPESLRGRLRKGESPPESNLDPKTFLRQQESFYKGQGYKESEIRELLKRDYTEAFHGN